MKKIIATGKSVEDAIKAGLNELNVSEDRVKVHVLELPTKGLFGMFGAKEARVEMEMLPDVVDEAILFLRDVFNAMNVHVNVEKVEDDEGITLNLCGDDLGILIGRRGQTLDSLQYLANIVANRFSNKHTRILLDAENFRKRRRQTLEELSERLAKKVVITGKEVMLEPMSPQERKIIHSKLQNHLQVKTYSKGLEPNRRVVIALK